MIAVRAVHVAVVIMVVIVIVIVIAIGAMHMGLAGRAVDHECLGSVRTWLIAERSERPKLLRVARVHRAPETSA